jgi:hypothetical protein
MCEAECHEWENISTIKKICYYCGKIKYCSVEEGEQYYKAIKRAPIESIKKIRYFEDDLDKYPGDDEDGLDQHYKHFVKASLSVARGAWVRDVRRLAATKIQLAWKECRDNPKYKMCHKIHIQMMEDDGYEFA